MTDEPSKQPSGVPAQLWKFVSTASKKAAASLGQGLKGLASLRTLVAIAVGVILLHLFDFLTIPFWPFTTTGRIYVDSPEVYTRERLVNDRYDQGYWLREQLKKLDHPEELHLVVGESVRASRVGTGDTEGGSPDSLKDAEAEATTVPRRLPYEQQLRVASGIRDMLRQQILENMLDDRHDLTGNTVYGLKFDTTVVPGNNTRRRAFVHVSLTIDDLFHADRESPPRHDDDSRSSIERLIWSENESSADLGEHVKGWIVSHLAPHMNMEEYQGEVQSEVEYLLGRYRDQEDYYIKWLSDITRRLNRAEDSVYESMRDECLDKDAGNSRDAEETKHRGGNTLTGREFFDKLTAKTLERVLGIPEERFMRLNESQLNESGAVNASTTIDDDYIKLPDPWAKFFWLSRESFTLADEDKENKPCSFRVWFDAIELNEQLILVRTEKGVNFGTDKQGADGADIDGDASEELVPIAESYDGKWDISFPLTEYELREKLFEENNLDPQYAVSAGLVDKLLFLKSALCELRLEEGEYCEDGNRVNAGLTSRSGLPSGLFNFVEHMSARDAYSYAVFPKNDVEAIFAETSAQLSATAPATGFLDLATRLTETRTSSRLVGYGDGGGGGPEGDGEHRQGDGSIDFGWVISSRGDMEPTQKNELALVSVPAWTDTLKLRVSVGWLDRQGKAEIDEDSSFDLDIAVPPSLEVFDSIFREDPRVTLGPSIRESDMDEGEIYVRSGMEARILIPGSRLWRSTEVTLGAQMAKRITVLPNMEGIIAEFGPVDPPYAAQSMESGMGSRRESMASSTGHLAQHSESDEPGNCREKRDEIKIHGLSVRPVPLRVWTSEGVTKAKRVCVVYDPDEVLAKTTPEKQPSVSIVDREGEVADQETAAQ